MTWADEHAQSQDLAARADILVARGHSDAAVALYQAAAEAEERAIGFLDSSKPKTLGVTLVSAVTLYYRAAALDRA